MNIRQGQFHRRTDDVLVRIIQAAICAIILLALAMVGVDAWIKEDTARVAKLKKHIYDIALSRGTYGPAAPTGVRPRYDSLATPKTKVFQDASQPREVKP